MQAPLNETDLLHHLIKRVPFAYPQARVFRRNIIKRVVVENGRKFMLRNGIAGQSDAYALIRGGMHIEIETKAATGKVREAQERWQDFCRTFGIPHIVLRASKGEFVDDTVNRWIDELRAVVEKAA